MYYYLGLLWLKQQSRTSKLAAFDHSGNVFSEPSILKNYCGLLPTVKSDSRLLHEKSILPSIQSTKSVYYFVFGISAKKVGPTAVIMYFPYWNLHYLSCT